MARLPVPVGKGPRGYTMMDTTDELAYEDGVELEREDEAHDEITTPFDPGKIRVRTINVVVDQVVQRVKHGEIDLAPDFQRRAGIWTPQGKSRLIESLLLRIPIPVFYVAADSEDKWQVVDGIQRISTINDYVAGEFSLRGLQYLGEEYADVRYSDLPRSMQRRINETQLVVNVIDPGTPEEVMFNIFHRINTGGAALRGQEIRHALHPGPVREYLKDLSCSVEFLAATNGSVSPTRMADRECVLRFLAFHIDPWEEYTSNDLDGYLGEAMAKINCMEESEHDQIASVFKAAMDAALAIFGEQAFRKPPTDKGKKRPISKALFETWSIGLARCSEIEQRRLARRKQGIVNQFRELLADDHEFDRAISYSTGTPKRVLKRFRTIDELIHRCLS